MPSMLLIEAMQTDAKRRAAAATPISHHIGHVRAAIALLRDAEKAADAAAVTLSTVPHFADEWEATKRTARVVDTMLERLVDSLERKLDKIS